MNIKVFAAAVLASASAFAHAGVIVGGSSLLDNDGLAQLETWLGRGQLTLTNVFTKIPGSTSFDFHRAVDGKGATFSLLSVSRDSGLTWYTIGGYAPLSWDSSGQLIRHATPEGYLFDAFVFNLTTSTKFGQTDTVQTVGAAADGPYFGGGDIYVNTSLARAKSGGASYLDGNSHGISIVDGTPSNGSDMPIDKLEVFTISDFTSPASVPTDVPEPTSTGLLGIGLAVLATARRNKRT